MNLHHYNKPKVEDSSIWFVLTMAFLFVMLLVVGSLAEYYLNKGGLG